MDKNTVLSQAIRLYFPDGCRCVRIPDHEGGRNILYVITSENAAKYVLRISCLPDRTESDYLAETEFVHYLAQNGAPAADVIPSVHHKLVERIECGGQSVFLSLFEYAKGMLISDNGYRWREGAPLEEYFFNTGKALGAIHRLSKAYVPAHRRQDYADKYSREYLERLIPDDPYLPLKQAIFRRLDQFLLLPADPERYGMIHFDFSDGNYHVDLETGRITVFDFDNCMYCWYLFDLANLWTHGEGWCRGLRTRRERKACMKNYFNSILAGYRTQTDIPEDLLSRLPLFIDMVLIENIVDEFECCARTGTLPQDEDIRDAADCLIRDIPYAGII